MSRLAALRAAGVSAWLDDLSRARLTGNEHDGSLSRLISTRSIAGVTTNPTIFANAVRGSDLYDFSGYTDVDTAVRDLTCTDVQMACDVLRPIYDANGDGRVSIEVDPRLAHETEATIQEARELWARIDRPNLYIKVPATPAGLPAIRQLIADGISVNVTLIFSLDRYRDVTSMFIEGISQRLSAGEPVDQIASVASFFVSRVDTEIDRRLEGDLLPLRGQAALANARLAYQLYEEVFSSQMWQSHAARGAKPQRPLWASTGVKDPSYRDTMYVEELIAPNTVNTMPESTLHAFADHGQVIEGSAARGYIEARELFATLQDAGINYDEVISLLEQEGVSKFIDSWNELLQTVSTAIARS
jgi:transaldolase